MDTSGSARAGADAGFSSDFPVGVREDKPITKLDTRVTRHDGTVVLEGDAVCYTVQLA